MSLVKHIAIYSENPEKLSEFYVDVFGMKVIRKGKDDSGNPVSVWVTDGYLDMAIIKPGGEIKPGINHFGFTMGADEKAQIIKKLETRGIRPFNPRAGSDTTNRAYVEEGALDPDGNRFDLSTGLIVAGKTG